VPKTRLTLVGMQGNTTEKGRKKTGEGWKNLSPRGGGAQTEKREKGMTCGKKTPGILDESVAKHDVNRKNSRRKKNDGLSLKKRETTGDKSHEKMTGQGEKNLTGGGGNKTRQRVP